MRTHRLLRRQRGIALAVALILLIVVTLIGLAAARTTTTQERMTSNFYDREIAFQNAEAGLRAGAAAILGSAIGMRDCWSTGVPCLANPFADPNLPAGSITTVSGTDYQKGGNAASQPQYVIENMGEWDNPQTDTGYDQTANAAQYGAQGANLTSTYYRVTARSGDPTVIGERAVVVLQAMYRQ